MLSPTEIIIQSFEGAFAITAVALFTILLKKVNKVLNRQQNKGHLSFEKQIEFDFEAKKILLHCLDLIDADKIFVSRFHNGDYFEDDIGALKKSRIYEVVKPGMSKDDLPNYQAILISRVMEEMVLIKQEGPAFTTIEEIPDCKFSRMLRLNGIRAVARCAVRKEGKIIGFIGADFIQHSNKPENIEELCITAGQIEQIMSRMYKALGNA